MRSIQYCFLCFTILILSFSPFGQAQEKPAEKPKLMGRVLVPPTTGFRAEFLEELTYYEQRYTKLADAMPAEKYAWRPGEGVRSVGEVFAHIAVANYLVGRTLNPLPPGANYGVDSQTVAKTTMALSGDKPKLIQALKDSFAALRSDVLQLNDEDADRSQKMFNRSTTLRGSFVVITGHFGEHLGQSIAYARMNGVVPPWTEESQQQQQKPGDKPKP
jgi:uncharacterized damage-inducible protein DinB